MPNLEAIKRRNIYLWYQIYRDLLNQIQPKWLPGRTNARNSIAHFSLGRTKRFHMAYKRLSDSGSLSLAKDTISSSGKALRSVLVEE